MNAAGETSASPIVVGLGEVLWDMFPEGAQFGGAPANFACHAAALGARASMISVVGNDPLGDQAIEALVSRGVDVACVDKTDWPTGCVNVSINSDGQPDYEIAHNVAWDYQGWNSEREALARSCDAVCFGTLGQRSAKSRKFIQEFLQRTRPDCVRVFDVNLRQSFYDDSVIMDSLQLASVLKLNDEELPIVCRAVGIEAVGIDALKAIKKQFGLDLIALTRGSEGAQLVGNKQTDFTPAVATTVENTVGAGDSYTAALTVGLLQGLTLGEINQAASKIAAFVCSQPGATPTLPTETVSLLRKSSSP